MGQAAGIDGSGDTGYAGGVKLLFTNNTLSRLAGTELAVRDLCLEMRRRGHEVAAFSPQHGEVAELLRAAGVPVLASVEEAPFEPDAIHGQHHLETLVAALRWPERPVISFCRGLEAWQEEPCVAPNVVRWVAVDEPCRGRLLQTAGVRAEAVRLVLNGIRLERFPARNEWPERPRRALVFSNYATADNFGGRVVRVCREAGLEAEIVGAGVGRTLAEPGQLLARQDVVFAKGKAALEALACGAAVVVCDERGLGPQVTTENFEHLRGESFGYPCMTEPVTEEGIRERLSQWSAVETEAVSRLARAAGGAERMYDELEALYREVAGLGVPRAGVEQARHAAGVLGQWLVRAKLGQEVWEEGVKRGLVERPAAGDGGRNEVGHNRMLDRLRKGLAALEEVKVLRKRARVDESQPGTRTPRRRWWQRIGGGKASTGAETKS